MNNDQINELLALMGQQIKDHAELREETTRRFEQLTGVMVNGFLRLEDKLGARIDNVAERVDHLTERVDHLTEQVGHLTEQVGHLTEEVAELKTDMRGVKAQVEETNRRLGNIFEHTGQLTEASQATGMRLSQLEQAQRPPNAALNQRLLGVEEQLRNAS